MKPILISGVQPSGRLHLGNYLGALKNFVDLQNSGKYQCFYFIADLHSLTEKFTPTEKRKQILSLLADYLTLGLQTKKSTIFIQSAIAAHTELAWIFNTQTPLGELQRMTQFKDKSITQKQNINVGLLTYPLLMAADILLYDAKFVPVGEDQLQHLELTRAIARAFNKRFSEIFTEPQPLLTKAPRIMSLNDPTKKMSKSIPQGCLFIDDSPMKIKKKIMAAATDSGKEIKYDPAKKAGVSNLLLIYSALTGKTHQQIEKGFAGRGYADFKKELADVVADYFADYRRHKKEMLKNKTALETIAAAGAKTAGKISGKKIKTVKEKLGLL